MQRLRASTENISLTRLHGGLELIRIGRPLRPELALWRYAARLQRRRIQHIATTGVSLFDGGGLFATAQLINIASRQGAVGLEPLAGFAAWPDLAFLTSTIAERPATS